MNDGFWIKNSRVEGDENLARLMEFSSNGNRIHSTATIRGNAWADGCEVGPHSVIGQDAEMYNCKIGAYCTVSDGCYLEKLEAPDHSYIESDDCAYGTQNGIYLVWTRRGLLVKPGCYPLEPVAKTLKRLSKPKKIEEWSWYLDYEKQNMADEIIEFLNDMNRYKVV